MAFFGSVILLALSSIQGSKRVLRKEDNRARKDFRKDFEKDS